MAATVPAAVRAYYIRPVGRWMIARAPAWAVARELERRVHGWYRIPNGIASRHVRTRFDVYPIDVGDHIRIQEGRVTAIGYAGQNWSEIIYVLPGGEIEPDPDIPEMAVAWAAYWTATRSAVQQLS